MKDLANKLAVLKELEAQVKQVRSEVADDLSKLMDEGDAKTARLDDGTKLGRVVKVAGRVSIYVRDERELLTWVRLNYPDDVVESVRPSFVNHLIDKAKRDGELRPGLDVREGDPYIRFNAEAGLREIVATRWPEIVGDSLFLDRWQVDQIGGAA